MTYIDQGPIPPGLDPFVVEEAIAATMATAEEFDERWPILRRGQRDLIPSELRRLIWVRDGRRCTRCGRARCLMQLDHIVPWSAGGEDTSSNLRLMCAPCNQDRSNFRSEYDEPVTPIVRACDACIREWVLRWGFTRYGRIIPGNPEIEVFCGNCEGLSTTTDPAGLM